MLAEGRVHNMELPDVVTSSSDYALRFAGATGAWLLEVQANAVISILKKYPNASVLDVAGGHGQIANVLAPLGYNVTVLGSSSECGINIEDLVKNGRCKFSVGDIEKLPYPDQSFDVVTCFRYLAHCAGWRSIIAELTRVARTAVVVDFPSFSSINFFSPLFFKLKNFVEGNTRPFAVLSKSAVDSEFKSRNFAAVSSVKQFFLPMALHRWMQRREFSMASEGFCKTIGLTGALGSPVIGHYRRSTV